MLDRPTERVSVLAHRGASRYAPENTLAALREAALRGIGGVEFDAKLSRDGHVVLMHDDTLARTTNGAGRVADNDWADLHRLDAGSWFGPQFAREPIPTLSAAIVLLAEFKICANVEIKPCPGRDVETARRVVETLIDEWPNDLPRPLLSSFSPMALSTARTVAPQLPRALLMSKVTADWRTWLDRLGCVAIHTDHRHLSRIVAEDILAAGFGLRCYTVNRATTAAKLFAWGVDAVFSDAPDRIPPRSN